jgi:hypothetical protein
MLVIGLVLSMFGIGLFCWLIFTFAVYALPFFSPLALASLRFIAALACWRILVGHRRRRSRGIGKVAFARPTISARAVIAAAFAVPAAIAGYHAVLGLSQIGVPSLLWREVFAWAGAIVIGCTAWVRMTVLADPLPLRPARAASDNSQRVLTAAATREG